MSIKPAIHGRDHRKGGADPIPLDVFLYPSALMGGVLPAARLSNGLGTNIGAVWIPSNEGPAPETGEDIEVSFSHADPYHNHFDWMGVRIHPVSGLSLDTYQFTEPWESSPFSASTGTSGTAASFDLGPIGGNFNGFFYGAVGVSDDDADTVHFETPGGEIDRDEDFGWDVAGVGHIGYIFHDFDTSETGNLTISFASGAGSEKAVAYYRCSRTGAVTVGATVGEDTITGTVRNQVTLTGDIDEDEAVIVVSASQGPDGFYPFQATAWPVVTFAERVPTSTLVPVYKVGSQRFPIMRDIGGLGEAGGDVDGGSP